MPDKSKPYLGGIQEFGTAAYVKDLKAGKLDAHAQQGHFVGYDFESKGFRIYWPTKRSITVERNVVFNGNDVQEKENSTVMVGVQSEGEKDKVIQHPENITEVKNQTENVDEPQNKDEDVTTSTKTTNSVIFPSTPTPAVKEETENNEIQQYGQGHCQ